jgi:hypothetical protein
MSFSARIKRALRGEVDAGTVALETFRRGAVSIARRRERRMIDRLESRSARLTDRFHGLEADTLVAHFSERTRPAFFPIWNRALQSGAAGVPHASVERTLAAAEAITSGHRWHLFGSSEQIFGPEIDWLREPASGTRWPADYHADLKLEWNQGTDLRILWELNRLQHLITLAQAFSLTKDEQFAVEFFSQIDSWRSANPVGKGPNWACAMEAAIRAINLLACFEVFRHSKRLTPSNLASLLSLFDSHGRHIRRNLEFSYISTSNHYLSDVVGLLWLGLMLPELEAADGWRDFGLKEMLREMDKQVLPDGADFEASTAYHRFVLELFLYTFLLCGRNQISIPEKYWKKLETMVAFTAAYVRPDGRAPLAGDNDSGRILPFVPRSGDDHAYLAALGAVLFERSEFKRPGVDVPDEVVWLFGEEGRDKFESLQPAMARSQVFKEAGLCIMRSGSSYLMLNFSSAGINGRGSHSHNDALSIELSACGSAFLIDPGTYVYTADLDARHEFRSTEYHSTVEVDGEEQNRTNRSTPFAIGDDARPKLLRWDSSGETDLAVAEHYGYMRLPQGIVHRRAVQFYKQNELWLMEDALLGAGIHQFRFSFHFAPSLEVRITDGSAVQARDPENGAEFIVASLDGYGAPELVSLFSATDYGSRKPSIAACWAVRGAAPMTARWALLPVCGEDVRDERLQLLEHLRKLQLETFPPDISVLS